MKLSRVPAAHGSYHCARVGAIFSYCQSCTSCHCATVRSQGAGAPQAAGQRLAFSRMDSWHTSREEERLNKDAHKKEMNREEKEVKKCGANHL